MPIGDQWAKRSTAHEWLGYLERTGALEKVRSGISCMADIAKLINWSQGAVDGSFSPRKERGTEC